MIIHKELLLPISSKQLWNLLTDSSHLAQWWSKNIILEPKVDGKFHEPWVEDGSARLAYGKVIEAKLNQRIKLSWKEDTWRPDQETVLELNLSETQNGLILTLIHSGWDCFPEAEKQKLLLHFNEGWDYLLNNLKKHIQSSQ